MRIFLLFLMLLSTTITAHCQRISYTYTSDSSVLSILFSGQQINRAQPSYSINLGKRWKYKKNTPIAITIRGALLNPAAGLHKPDSVKLQCSIFGKTYIRSVSSEGNTTVQFRTTRNNLWKHPLISITWAKLPERKRTFQIDSIDMQAETEQ